MMKNSTQKLIKQIRMQLKSHTTTDAIRTKLREELKQLKNKC